MSMIRPRYSQADEYVTVRRSELEEIVKQTLRSKWQFPYDKGFGKPGHGTGGAPVLVLQTAIVTSPISQCSGTSFGSGEVQIYSNDGDPNSFTSLNADPDSSVTPVWNWFTTSGTIATGKHCFVSWFSGNLWLIVWEC
jgi:hypothetical protein